MILEVSHFVETNVKTIGLDFNDEFRPQLYTLNIKW